MLSTLAWMLVAVTLLPAHRAARQRSRNQFVALLALDAISIGMILVASSSVAAWSAIAQEDGAVEWATFVAFVMAAGYLVVVVRKVSPSRWFKGACLLLALFCLVIAGEEVSWGQRLFGFRPPDVFLERNFQQELNVHNVLMHEGGLGFKLESKHLVMAIALGFGLVLPVVVRRGRFRVFAPLAPPFAFVPIALGIIAAEKSYPVELTGEGAEMMTGFMFLASAVVATEIRPSRAVAWIVAPLVIGMLLATVMSRFVFGSDEDGQRVARVELLQLQADVAQGVMPKLRNKTNVHKRVFTSTRDGYLHLAGGGFLDGRGTPAEPDGPPPRDDRQGYFLDPWNSPYWIYYEQKSRSVALYSFGPNRRRDLALRDIDGDLGDDVLVRFVLPGSKDETPSRSRPGP